MNKLEKFYYSLKYGRKAVKNIEHNSGYIYKLYLLSQNAGRPFKQVLEEHYNVYVDNEKFSSARFLGLSRYCQLNFDESSWYKQLVCIVVVKNRVHDSPDMTSLVVRSKEEIEAFMDKKYTPLWRKIIKHKRSETTKPKRLPI